MDLSCALNTEMHLWYGSSSLAHSGQRCIPLHWVCYGAYISKSFTWVRAFRPLLNRLCIPALVPCLLAETGGKQMPARIFVGDGLKGQLHAACIPAGSLYLIFSPSWPWATQPRGSSPRYTLCLLKANHLKAGCLWTKPVPACCIFLRGNKE